MELWNSQPFPHRHIHHLFHNWRPSALHHSETQGSLRQNLDTRCVSQANELRNGPTAPKRLSGYSILSCVWLRFPLLCVKGVIKKYGLRGSKVFQGLRAQRMSCVRKQPGKTKPAHSTAVFSLDLFVLMQGEVIISIRMASFQRKSSSTGCTVLKYSTLRQKGERDNWNITF